MTEPSRLYRNPLLMTAAYLALGVAAVSSLYLVSDPLRRAVGVLAYSAFGLLIAFFRAGHDPRKVHVYLGAEAALVILLLVAFAPYHDPLVLFNVLSVYAALLLPPRSVVGWIGFMLTVTGLFFLYREGWLGLIPWVGQTSGYLAFGIVGGALRQAEIARRQSQALLAELHQAHRQLQDYAEQSQKLAIAEERNRLARDLHDSAKQQAFALSAQLDAAHSLLLRDPQAAQTHLQRAEQLADNLRQELATLIFELRLPTPGNAGLAAALRQHTADWSQQSNIPITVHVQGPARALPPEIEHNLFRIAQEALANVARHSRAQCAEVRLEYAPGGVTLTIQDDGQGFDVQQTRTGVGTHSMRERAATLPRGALAIESRPGHGTRLTVQCQV